MTTATKTLIVHAIDPSRLDRVRAVGEDCQGNPVVPFDAEGGEPLRCCLRRARPDDSIALISYTPFEQVSVWREMGPIYVHAQRCDGHDGSFPHELCDDARLLRTYRGDRTMNYDHNTVFDGGDIEAVLDGLLDEPDVAIVHVRTLVPQCFLFEVRAQT